MTAPLDEKGLEVAAKALYEDDDVWSNAFAWPDLAEKQTPASRYRELAATAIRAYLAASPSPSEMEVATPGWEVTYADGRVEMASANPGVGPSGKGEIVATRYISASDALSQAQSALAAMRAERDEAQQAFKSLIVAMANEGMGVGPAEDGSIVIRNRKAEAAEARIKALEEAKEGNK